MSTTKMVGNRQVTTSGNYTVQNTELYRATWADGCVTWLEAISVKQATLLHTLLQKERPVAVVKETTNRSRKKRSRLECNK